MGVSIKTTRKPQRNLSHFRRRWGWASVNSDPHHNTRSKCAFRKEEGAINERLRNLNIRKKYIYKRTQTKTNKTQNTYNQSTCARLHWALSHLRAY